MYVMYKCCQIWVHCANKRVLMEHNYPSDVWQPHHIAVYNHQVHENEIRIRKTVHTASKPISCDIQRRNAGDSASIKLMVRLANTALDLFLLRCFWFDNCFCYHIAQLPAHIVAVHLQADSK